LNATKEVDVESREKKIGNSSGMGNMPHGKKNSIIDCSANVTKFGKGMRVRVNFQKKILDNKGGTIAVTYIEDPLFYQEFFIKVDKGIFIEKEKI